MGLGTGTASVIAREIGEGDRLRAQRLTTDSLLLSLLIVGIFSSLGLITIEPLFSTLGARPELHESLPKRSVMITRTRKITQLTWILAILSNS